MITGVWKGTALFQVFVYLNIRPQLQTCKTELVWPISLSAAEQAYWNFEEGEEGERAVAINTHLSVHIYIYIYIIVLSQDSKKFGIMARIFIQNGFCV